MPTFPQPGLERRWKKLPGQPDGDTGDPYTGYDRFGRTERTLWGRPQEGGGFESLVQVQWGYDRASLKTWRTDLLAPAATNQDQHFGYDGLYQVTQRQRGLLNTNATAIGGVPAQQEDFGYDETGNWVSYRQANAGELDIDQARVNNRSNQITQVDGSSAGVSYDKNGNMLTVPTGEGLTGPPRKLVWDAWNRLREVRNAENTLIASYQYDAASRRTVEMTGADETAVARHCYYNDQWRSVEERLDTSTEPERQQVWHPADRYELLLRDRSTGNDGELDERLYPMKDQLDPVALCDATGSVVERYAYSAFGMTTFLNADFSPISGNVSSLLWNFLFHAEFADPSTGWFNYGYRYYLPELGRWPSRDPLGEWGGVNTFCFAANAPSNGYDTLGLVVCCPRGQVVDDYGNCCTAVKQYKDTNGKIKCGVAGVHPPKKPGGGSIPLIGSSRNPDLSCIALLMQIFQDAGFGKWHSLVIADDVKYYAGVAWDETNRSEVGFTVNSGGYVSNRAYPSGSKAILGTDRPEPTGGRVFGLHTHPFSAIDAGPSAGDLNIAKGRIPGFRAAPEAFVGTFSNGKRGMGIIFPDVGVKYCYF